MSPCEIRKGMLLEIALPPCRGGWSLAGNHPVVVVGYNKVTGELYVLAITSNAYRKEKIYFLSSDISGLRHDSYVLVGQVRCIEPTVWHRARPLGQLPSIVTTEIEKDARRALRQVGLAA